MLARFTYIMLLSVL